MKKQLIIFVLTLLCLSSNSWSQQLALDNSFGTNGIAIDVNNAEINNIQELSDGRLLSAGYYIDNIVSKYQVIRYNKNGSLDPTFANNGIARTTIGYYQDYADNIIIQNDGKVVVAGGYQDYQLGPYHTAICRYKTNGALDSSFGNNGILRMNWGVEDGLSEVKIQADQKLVLAGYISNSSTNYFALIRLLPNGSLDSSFGNNGLVTTNFSNPSVIHDLEILQDGTILVCGYEGVWTFAPGSNTRFALAKYQYDGSLDNNFGNGGVLLMNINPLAIDCATKINELSNGELLISGFSADALALIKLTSNGVLDNSFGQSGQVSYSTEPAPTSINLLSNGKILISGNKPIASFDYGLNIIQLNTDGSIDSSFGAHGIYQSNISNGADYVQSAILLSSGQYLCAGSSQGNNLLAQYTFDAPNSITDLNTIKELSVYPNPSSDEINISFELQEKADVSIQLINTSGQVVASIVENKKSLPGLSNIKLSIDSFPAGNYFVILKAGEHKIVKKIIIH